MKRSAGPAWAACLVVAWLGVAGCEGLRHGARTVTLSVVGTNDLHGHVDALPVLGGFLANLRRVRARDGGVLLVDAGDMFQGTLESNLGEGAVVVEAYNALGYAAAAIGNHEFDFGPVGEDAVVRAPGEDPVGALRARASEARFPFLAANLLDRATGRPVAWPNVRPSLLVPVAGVPVGLVGVITHEALQATNALNVRGLRVGALEPAVRREAMQLRAAGAALVVVVAHAGGECRSHRHPDDLGSCRLDGEVFRLAQALPPGLVQVIVGGHTHSPLAHRVAGIAIIESYAEGRAFGRVDVVWDRAARRVVSLRVLPPHDLCRHRAREGVACEPGSYEGSPVVPATTIARVLAPAVERARALREQPLGVRVEAAVRRDYEGESPLGNLFADLMRAAVPGADAALVNAGSLRAVLPVGELTYGRFYEAMPFDNRLAVVRLRGRDLAQVLAGNLVHEGGVLLIAGLRATASCVDGRPRVQLAREDGRPVGDDELLSLVTSDYLVTNGGPVLARAAAVEGALSLRDQGPLRDAMVQVLRARGGRLRGDDPALYDPAHPRLAYPGSRPVHCPAGPASP